MERLAGWMKTTLIVLPIMAGVFIAWGTLRSDVQHIERTVSTHITRPEVELLQAEILRRLDRIERKLDAEAAR